MFGATNADMLSQRNPSGGFRYFGHWILIEENKMNKLFALIAICGLAVAFAACPDKPAENKDKPVGTAPVSTAKKP